MAKKKTDVPEAEVPGTVTPPVEAEVVPPVEEEAVAPVVEDVAPAAEDEPAPVETDGSKMGEAAKSTKSRKQAIRDARMREADRERRAKENAEFLAGWAGLQAAQRSGTIMYGTVTGVEEISKEDMKGRENADDRSSIMLLLIHNERYRVSIPFAEVYRHYPIDMNTVSTETEAGRRAFVARQKAMAEKLFGLEVPFVVKGMFYDENSGQHFIRGSRAEALASIERRNFEPDREGNTAMQVGDFVSATITSISNYSIAVNVGGVDTRISIHQLTYRFIDGPYALRKMYHIGDEIMVQIQDVKKNADGSHSIVVSAKPAELIRAKSRQNVIVHEGEQCFGTVTGVRKARGSDKVFISLYLDAYGLPAITNSFPPNRMGFYPQPGETVRVTVKTFNENGMTYCMVRSTHGAPNLMRSEL